MTLDLNYGTFLKKTTDYPENDFDIDPDTLFINNKEFKDNVYMALIGDDPTQFSYIKLVDNSSWEVGNTTGVLTTINVNSNLVNFNGIVAINTSSHLIIPSGTTAQRPGIPTTGSLRLNTATSDLEYYNNGTWLSSKGIPKIEAWCEWDSTGSISGDYNVTSIVDDGVGSWTVNYTTNISSENHASLVSVLGQPSNANDGLTAYCYADSVTSTTVRCTLVGSSTTAYDPQKIYLAVIAGEG